MPCQEEKLKKERPETDTSAHAWPYDRTGIPITYARKNAAPLALDVQAVALSADKPPIALIILCKFYRPFEDLIERDRARSLGQGNEENIEDLGSIRPRGRING